MSIKLKGSSDGSVSFDAPADTSPSGSDITLTLPTSAGSANQFLKNSGTAGTLEYSSMVETSTGIGIGTSAPQTHLEVKGANTLGKGQLVVSSASAGQEARMTFIDGSDDIAEISTNGDHLYFYNERSSGAFQFYTGGSERARLDSSGRLLVGTTSSTAFNGVPSAVQVEGTTNATTRMSIRRTANDSSAGVLVFGKARSSSHAVLSNNDEIGKIEFYGADGTDTNQRAGMIVCAVDGTPGSNDMPGRLSFFSTLDGASTPSEQMRITSDGVVNFGDSPSTNANADLSGSGNKLYISLGHSFGANAISTNVGAYTGAYTHHAFYNGNGFVGDIQTSGSSTSFNTSSDYRLKENVVDLDGAITRVKQLQPRRFNFITDAETTVDGFIAHEAQTVVPEAVTGTHNEVDDDGNAVMQGIDQSKLVPLLTAALQEAIAKIETLETKVAALEAA